MLRRVLRTTIKLALPGSRAFHATSGQVLPNDYLDDLNDSERSSKHCNGGRIKT